MPKKKQEQNQYIYDPPKEAIAGGVIVDIMQTVIIALAICVFIYLFLFIPNQVDGQSMEPNFSHNELLLTNKVIQLIGDTSIGEKLSYDYKRGDVVIFQLPGHPDFIKRIVAEPGDTVKIEDNHPVINGKLIKEAYIPTTFKTVGGTFLEDGEELTVPSDSYFVMGDNREASKDSRANDVGFVERKYVKGKVFLRWWPLGDFGLIESGKYEEEEIEGDDNTEEQDASYYQDYFQLNANS